MTLREKINDILAESRKDDYDRTKYLWRTKYGSKSVSQVILDCIKDSMPEELPKNYHPFILEGYEMFRTEMLRILEQ